MRPEYFKGRYLGLGVMANGSLLVPYAPFYTRRQIPLSCHVYYMQEGI